MTESNTEYELSPDTKSHIDGFHDRVRQMHAGLLEVGWYLPLGRLTLAWASEWANLFLRDGHRPFEDMLTRFAEELSEGVEQSVSNSWPDRSTIIKAAFNAHREHQYAVSVPTLLAQADGITTEMLGASLYSKKGHLPLTLKALKKWSAQFDVAGESYRVRGVDDMLLLPWSECTGLSRNTIDRDKDRECGRNYSPLNRHGVLHGLDLDYATKANSCRCILLLDFLRSAKESLARHAEYAQRWKKDWGEFYERYRDEFNTQT